MYSWLDTSLTSPDPAIIVKSKSDITVQLDPVRIINSTLIGLAYHCLFKTSHDINGPVRLIRFLMILNNSILFYKKNKLKQAKTKKN